MSPRLRPVTLALVATLGLTAFTPAAHADADAGGFGAEPAERDADGATRAYFQVTQGTGARSSQVATVTNFAKHPVTLRVGAVDGLTGTTSGAVYANAGARRAETGRWIRPTVRRVTLRAGERRTVAFTLAVPRGAAPGDHLGGLAFEDAARHRSGGRFSVTQVIRVVVGVSVRVPGPAKPQLGVSGLAVKALPGTQVPSVVVGLRNRGHLLCQPTVAVTLTGAGTVRRKLDTVLPGDTIAYPVAWPRPLKAGRYRARVRTSGCGRPGSRLAVVRLGGALSGTARNPKLGVVAAAEPVTLGAEAHTPWLLIALVGGVGVALGGLVARRRPRHGLPPVA